MRLSHSHHRTQRLKNWPQEESKLNSIYLGGGIVSEAHTHCSEVESVVWDLCSRKDLQNTPGLSQIRDLGYSVVVQDRDVIIPVMRAILDRTRSELAIIGKAIRKGNRRRAIRLKEKYWFDVEETFQTIRGSLDTMRQLADDLGRPSS